MFHFFKCVGSASRFHRKCEFFGHASGLPERGVSPLLDLTHRNITEDKQNLLVKIEL
jgi:hypothetical protein